MRVPTEKLIELNEDNDTSSYLRAKLASYLGLNSLPGSKIRFINGADAAIHAIAHAFIRNRKVQYCDLNYGYATSLIKQYASESTETQTSWDLFQGSRSLPDIHSKAQLLYLSLPDNRLGLDTDKQALKDMILQNPNIIFIIDESYRDYCPANSAVKLTLEHSNLLIVRTFSKFFNIENSRVGYILRNPRLIKLLDPFIPQYPIATCAINSTLQAIETIDTKAKINTMENRKIPLYATLDQINLKYSKSCTNFITVFDPDEKTLALLHSVSSQVKVFPLKGHQCFRVRLF